MDSQTVNGRIARVLWYSREDLAKATCRKFLLVVVDPGSWRMIREGTPTVSTRGVKVPNWDCPNWTELPTIRHSLAAKPSAERKKRRKTRDAVVLSSPLIPTNLHGETTTASQEGKYRVAKVYNVYSRALCFLYKNRFSRTDHSRPGKKGSIKACLLTTLITQSTSIPLRRVMPAATGIGEVVAPAARDFVLRIVQITRAQKGIPLGRTYERYLLPN